MAQRRWHSADLGWHSPSLSSHPRPGASLYFPTKPDSGTVLGSFSPSLPVLPWYSRAVDLCLFLLHCPPQPSRRVCIYPLTSTPTFSSPALTSAAFPDLIYASYCASMAQISAIRPSPKRRSTFLVSALQIPVVWPLPVCPTWCLSSSLAFTQAFAWPGMLSWISASLMHCSCFLRWLPRYGLSRGLMLLWSYPSLPKANPNAHHSVPISQNFE